jgi:sugar phosphate isomerase/epimerase
MCLFSVSQRCTPGWSFEEDVVYFSQAGIPGIGIWREKLLQVGEEKAVELLADSSVKPCYIDWAGGFTGSKGWSYREAIQEAIRFIYLASRIGAKLVIIHSGARGRHTFNHSRRILREALKELVPAAEGLGICLGLEPVDPTDPEELTFLQTIAETVDFVTTIGSSHLKLIYDLGHLGADEAVLEAMRQWLPHLALVQLADRTIADGRAVRVPLGRGLLPVAEIARTLIREGYRGWFDFELWGPHFSEIELFEVLKSAKALFGTIIGPAASACSNPSSNSPGSLVRSPAENCMT